MRPLATFLLCMVLAGVAATSAGAASLLVVNGRGWGHGIGMSQYGAQGFAANGWDYRGILAHYYPGTAISAAPQTSVRVLVADAKVVAIRSDAAFVARAADGRVVEYGAETVRFGPKLLGLAGPVRVEPGAEPLRVNGRAYRGTVVLHGLAKTVLAVNELQLDHYLYGVVPDEMPPFWNAEALKAQAVAARSYALVSRKSGRPYDVFDDVRSQVYNGIAAEDWRASAAIDATAGEILTFGGAVASTFFFSTSGGKTASIADEWGSDPVPYLVSRPDPHDSISPHHRWGPVAFTGNQARKRLGMLLDDVEVRLNGSGRVGSVVARRGGIVRELSGASVRTRLGLRSTWFSLALLTLDAPARVGVGESVLLQGRLRGVEEATLQRRAVGGAWEDAGAVRAGADGRFEIRSKPAGTTAYRLVGAGAGGPAVRVVVQGRPSSVPKQIPAWAWQMLEWQRAPAAERGERPAAAPKKLPAWYWAWKLWRLHG